MPPPHILLAGLLGALALHAGLVHWLAPDATSNSSTGEHFWRLFLYGAPLSLAAIVMAHQRWAFMGSIIYATINLALDIATFVFGVTHEQGPAFLALTTGISAALSVLVIVVGGRGFLTVNGSTRPPIGRLPNPPSQPAP